MRKKIWALAAVLGCLGPSGAEAAAFLVTIENPTVQSSTSTFTYSGVESFASRATTGMNATTSFTSKFGGSPTITGAYNNVNILGADAYGGAGGTGNYAAAWSNFSASSYSIGLSTTNTQGINYFGLWVSAADPGNTLQFYNDGSLLYTFSTADFLSKLSSMPGASAYYGNPNGNNNGISSSQAFGFLNFYDRDGTFNRVVLTQNSTFSGFESDNHTVGRYSSISGTTIAAVPEPASWAMMIVGFGFVGCALRSNRAKGLLIQKG